MPQQLPYIHATRFVTPMARPLARLRVLGLGLLCLLTLNGWAAASEQATESLPTRAVLPTPAGADEAARWQAAGGATIAADAAGLQLRLPAQADAALRRDLSAEFADFSSYPSLQLLLQVEAAGHLSLRLTDADGKSYSETMTIKSGENHKQLLLAKAAATVNLRQIRQLALETPEPTQDTPLAERQFRLSSITLGAALSESADEIQNAWYFYYLRTYGYLAFFLVLMAISFGVPLPEEIFHLSAGYLAYLTKTQPEIGINVHIIAPLNMFTTLIGDIIIYYLGRTKGERIRQYRWFKWVMPDAAFVKVREWFDRWGVGATFMFRFIPPIRMPGYFASGLLRQSPMKFILADGLACLISVPTQIYLVYFYGDWIIEKVKQANFMIAIVAVILVVGFIVYKLATRKKRAAEKAAAEALMHSPEVEAVLAEHKSTTGIPILDGADADHLHIKHLNQEANKATPAPEAKPPEPGSGSASD